jgi:hypothetical protein
MAFYLRDFAGRGGGILTTLCFLYLRICFPHGGTTWLNKVPIVWAFAKPNTVPHLRISEFWEIADYVVF